MPQISSDANSYGTHAGLLSIVAPLSGVVVPLERVPDPAFAQHLVGSR